MEIDKDNWEGNGGESERSLLHKEYQMDQLSKYPTVKQLMNTCNFIRLTIRDLYIRTYITKTTMYVFVFIDMCDWIC